MNSSKFQNIEPRLQQFPRAKLDNFFVLQTLGSGTYGKVKLIEDLNRNRYAAKIFKEDSELSVENFNYMVNKEVMITKALDHPNIIKILDTKEKGIYTTFKGVEKIVCYIVMEIAEGGTLIDYLMLTGRFPDSIARVYFKQMLGGITAVHNSQIVHHDIKPENILFDVKHNVKLCDFGLGLYCGPVKGGKLAEFCGTRQYWLPEMHANKAYKGQELDIYALGLILFILVTGTPAFQNGANLKDDPWFKCFVENNQGF